MNRRLTRSRHSRMIAGVCGGIAEYLSADPTVVRLIWVLLALFPGTFLVSSVGYLVAWFVIPEESS